MKARVPILLFALLALTVRAQTPDKGWRLMNVPGAGVQQDSFVWYRCFVKLPAEWAGQSLTLAVDAMDNAHEAYLNGAKVGGAGRFPPGYQSGLNAAGRYALPPDPLRFGDWNLVAIRCYDPNGRDGFKTTAPVLGTDRQHMALAGPWEVRAGDNLAWAGSAGLPLSRPAGTLSPALSGGEGRGEGAPSAATFSKVEQGPAPKPSGGHKMSDRSTPLPPADAAKSFTVPDDLEIEQVLAEPIVRQPVFMNFDERGRLWVVQYIQYPAPAGLKVVSKDQFWRAVYDKVPEPPPRGLRGLDKITIHEDTDGDGIFDKHKTFVDGLNIATACVKGRGGLWVLNPPYLLFYPDKDGDDVPDGDPVVHLEGFGLEDTHSVVNSLRWGPDGWLYAAQGSTVTANVRVMAEGRAGVSPVQAAPEPKRQRAGGAGQAGRLPYMGARSSTRPSEPPVYSQGQNIWRYHPEKHIYEIFAEGGGNAFGVEFDDKGRLFSGHNGGDTRGFHYMQGAYLRKGFEKHGELSNPYAFGYFPQMDGTKGERFTHNFVIYHGGALPARYEGKLFGVEPLQGRVVLSEITPDGSTFKTRDLERVVTSSDSWFRPVDIKAGPDGAIYIADWYDRQVTHTRNQEGNIDASNGRIYRLKKKGAKAAKPFNLASLSGEDLARSLGHSNSWMRQTALQVLRDRSRPEDLEAVRASVNRMQAVVSGPFRNPTDKPAMKPFRDDQASWEYYLDYFWALVALTNNPTALLESSLSSASADARLWAIRTLGDDRMAPSLAQKLDRMRASRKSGNVNPQTLFLTDEDLDVRAQLACTAKRLPAADALPVIANLLRQDEDAKDPRLPLLCWWTIESKCDSDREAVLKLFEDSTLWNHPMVEQDILARLMRRFAATGTHRDLLTCAKLLELSPSRAYSEKLMKGFEEAFKGRSATGLPEDFIKATQRHEVGSVAFKIRQGHEEFLPAALKSAADPKLDREQRRQFIETLGEIHPRDALDTLLQLADTERDIPLRKAALTALLGYEDPRIPATVLRDYGAFPPDVRPVALTLLASRASWSLALAEAVEEGRLKPADVPPDTIRQIRRHKSDRLAALLSRHWPNAGRPTTEEMQKQIHRFTTVVRDGRGDPYAGQKLFQASCAVCHTLFARGGQVGPDLTTYQRSDLDTLLLHIVNPSAEIREGYESFMIETKDERSFSGCLIERNGRMVVIRGPDGQNVALDQNEISEMKSAGMSLMPEGLLDALTDQQVRDLFAYLRSTQPLAN